VNLKFNYFHLSWTDKTSRVKNAKKLVSLSGSEKRSF